MLPLPWLKVEPGLHTVGEEAVAVLTGLVTADLSVDHRLDVEIGSQVVH